MSLFARVALDGIVPEETAPDPARVIAGAPRFRTWAVETREAEGLHAGVWEASPGAWRIMYTEWEYCRILSGRSVITPDGGAPMHVGSGDSFILRPGFTGVWEVIETTRKDYVIRL